jgi:hypothetical protein
MYSLSLASSTPPVSPCKQPFHIKGEFLDQLVEALVQASKHCNAGLATGACYLEFFTHTFIIGILYTPLLYTYLDNLTGLPQFQNGSSKPSQSLVLP